MPRQNRSDPSGTLHAVPHKGTLMGNRGRSHKGGQIVRHRDSTARWISCTLEPVFGKRKAMGDSYTEIFFLDEVTALAAGHRPCAQCSRERYSRFVAAWRSAGLPTSGRMAETMDRTLDIDRRATERPEVDVRNLPDGCASCLSRRGARPVSSEGAMNQDQSRPLVRIEVPWDDVAVSGLGAHPCSACRSLRRSRKTGRPGRSAWWSHFPPAALRTCSFACCRRRSAKRWARR